MEEEGRVNERAPPHPERDTQSEKDAFEREKVFVGEREREITEPCEEEWMEVKLVCCRIEKWEVRVEGRRRDADERMMFVKETALRESFESVACMSGQGRGMNANDGSDAEEEEEEEETPPK